MDIQLKKGILDACVLADLYNQDGYGYILLKDISTVIEISESTLYPILRRLEKAAYLTTYSRECDGRLRKYYAITQLGKNRLQEFRKEWAELATVYDFVNRRTNNE